MFVFYSPQWGEVPASNRIGTKWGSNHVTADVTHPSGLEAASPNEAWDGRNEPVEFS